MNEHWLLRYPNGDAFALALLPYDYVTIFNGRLPDYKEERTPIAFKNVIHDYQRNICVRDYNYEVIPPIEWETLAAFGIPITKEKSNDDERWLEIR